MFCTSTLTCYPLQWCGTLQIGLTSLHGQLDLPDLAPFYGVFRELPLAPISYDQQRYLRNVNWFGTIYHGLSRSRNDQRFTPKIARPGSGLSV